MARTRVETHLRATGGGGLVGGRLRTLLAALALVLLASVGLGSGRALWEVGGPPRLADPESYAGDLVVVGLAVLAGLPLIVSALRSRRRRAIAAPDPELPPPRYPWWVRPVALLAGACGIFLALQLLRLLPGSDPERGTSIEPPPQARPGVPATPAEGGLPPVHWWGLAGLFLVLLAAFAVAWRVREPRSDPEREPDPDGGLLEAVELSLEDIEREPDPRRAVIRAYARMECALDAHGVARRSAETSLEFLARALTTLDVGREAVERLTALFQRAKFSQHEVDGSMKAEALAALAALRAELSEAAA